MTGYKPYKGHGYTHEAKALIIKLRRLIEKIEEPFHKRDKKGKPKIPDLTREEFEILQPTPPPHINPDVEFRPIQMAMDVDEGIADEMPEEEEENILREPEQPENN